MSNFIKYWITGIICLFGSSIYSCYADYISGIPKIIDGDTIKVDDQVIRLICIDTPESKYRGRAQYCLDNETNCGEIATTALIDMIKEDTNKVGANQVKCYYEKRDMYNRILGECYQFDGRNESMYSINYKLINEGYAFYYPCKEHKTWKNLEEYNQLVGKGIFNKDYGGILNPKQWRKNGGTNTTKSK